MSGICRSNRPNDTHKDLVDTRSPFFFFALEGYHPVIPVEDSFESRVAGMGSLEDVEPLYNVRRDVKEMISTCTLCPCSSCSLAARPDVVRLFSRNSDLIRYLIYPHRSAVASCRTPTRTFSCSACRKRPR